MRVLIAEDDTVSRRLLTATLEKRGYRVVVTCDGKEAWDVLKRKNAPQLAILDWMMPQMDGLDVCRKVREAKSEPYIYIILLTAKGSKEDIAAGLDAGADDYVNKPFDARELHSRIRVGERIIGLQNSLAEHVEKLKELDRLKSDFISTVSHELRTPIAVMKGGVSLCLDGVAGEINDTQKELLSDTLENIERLTRLISDLLDISKIEAGKVTIRRSSTDICVLVDKVQKSFEVEADKKGVSLTKDCSAESIKIYVDGDKITQIFSNLVSNAIRFTDKGGTVSLKVVEKNNYVECYVADTGIGIAKHHLSKLFSKFEQIGRVEGPGYKGTGLGLAIAKGLVEKHGGKIWVESEPGKGTTFGFTIKKEPLPKVLIVDDAPNIVDVVKRFLSASDYQFIEAYDGIEALEKAKNESPSLIVLDLMLPGMNGYEVLEKLKKDKKTHDLPVLVISGASVDVDRIVKIEDHIKIPVVGKPIKPDELVNNVKELLVE